MIPRKQPAYFLNGCGEQIVKTLNSYVILCNMYEKAKRVVSSMPPVRGSWLVNLLLG